MLSGGNSFFIKFTGANDAVASVSRVNLKIPSMIFRMDRGASDLFSPQVDTLTVTSRNVHQSHGENKPELLFVDCNGSANLRDSLSGKFILGLTAQWHHKLWRERLDGRAHGFGVGGVVSKPRYAIAVNLK